MLEDYVEFCEKKLWRAWKERSLRVPLPFDSDASPEPYLIFGHGPKRLVVLTTNPGAAMDHQSRTSVQTGTGPLRDELTYAEAAPELGCFYESTLASRQAGHRIARLRLLSCCLGCDGVIQAEVIPFHSATLPQKDAVLSEIDNEGGLLGRYVGYLEKFLRDQAVVCIQAVSTRDSLNERTKLSPWLKRVAQIAGLDLNSTRFVRLLEKGLKTTAAAWVSRKGPRKALVLMMGSNNLPADSGLYKLAAELRGQLQKKAK